MEKQKYKNLYGLMLGIIIAITLYNLLSWIKETNITNFILFLVPLVIMYRVTYLPYILLKEKQDKKEGE